MHQILLKRIVMRKKLRLIIAVMVMFLMSIGSNAQNSKALYQCNFDCISCKDKVMKNIPYEKGVKNVDVDYENKLVIIEYKTNKNTVLDLQKALVKLGYHTQYLGIPTSFSVNGNCDMCKKKIETAAKSIKGVVIASWSATKKELLIALNDESIDLKTVHQIVANAGYDTGLIKADDAVYEKLHTCCKYER